MALIDLIFPKKCINCAKFGEFICADCFSRIKFNDALECPACLRPALNGMTHPACITAQGLDGAISVVVYNGVVKKLIYQFKYNPHLSKLASTISELMTEGLSQNESFYAFSEKYQPVLVPIPLSTKRLRERGYNHAELLSNYVAQYFKLGSDNKILTRSKETKPQFRLNREERKKNVEGAFDVAKSSKVPSSIILIDDIATSFATLKEAAKILKRKGARKVLAVTFAREI